MKWEKITNYSFTDEQNILIHAALQKVKPWDEASLKNIKKQIKEFHLEIQNNRCCYCQKDFTGEFTLVIDIEHILPKNDYKDLTFDMRNLSVACKRCNMNIKGTSLKHINDDDITTGNFCSSDQYYIIHPNLDVYEQHIERKNIDTGTIKICFYFVIESSEKGQFTKEFFKLGELQQDSFDKAQDGISPKEPVTQLSSRAKEILKLLSEQEEQ